MHVLILFSLTLASASAFTLNPYGPIHQNYSTNCIINLIKKHFVPYGKLLTILTTPNVSTLAYGIQNNVIKIINNSIKWPLEIINGKQIRFQSGEICLNCPTNNKKIIKQIFQPVYCTKFALLIVDGYEQLINSLDNYLDTENHDLHSYLFVYVTEIQADYEEVAHNILLYVWDNKILNSAVMVPKNSLRTFHVYGLDVFAPSEICGNNPTLKLLSTCKKGQLLNNTRLFGNKVPNTFNNCTIPTIAMRYPPFVLSKEQGFEVNILKEFGKILHLHFDISMEEDAIDWGMRYSKNNWSGPLQSVINTSAIAIGNIAPNADLSKDFDFSIAYFYEHMVWVVPIAAPIPQWKNIYVVLKYEIWIICFVYLILTALAFQMFCKQDEDPYYKYFGVNLLSSLRIMIGNAVPTQPQTYILRSIFMGIACYSLVVLTSYQTLLITHLTNPVYEHQISTVQEILNSDNGIGGIKSYKDYFKNSTDETSKKIYDMFEIYDPVNDTTFKWVLTVSYDRDTCTLASAYYIKYLFADHNPVVVDRHGDPKIFVLKEILFTYPIRMLLPKGFPLIDKFDKVLWKLIAGDLIRVWILRLHTGTNTQVDTEEQEDDDEDVKLTMLHLQGAFTLLLFGYIIGVLCFLTEIMVFKFELAQKLKKILKF